MYDTLRNFIKENTALIVGFFFALFPVFVYYSIFRGYSFSETTDSWGNFGSYLSGTLGVILGFLNLILLSIIFKKQEKSSSEQQIETTFFKLFESYSQNFNTLEVDLNYISPEHHSTASQNFVKFNHALRILVENESGYIAKYSCLQNGDHIDPSDISTYNYRPQLNHFITSRYFIRNFVFAIASLFKFINTSSLSNEKKKLFTEYIKNHLSDDEKFLMGLFYIQIKENLKNYFTFDEIRDFLGSKTWILQPLFLKDQIPFFVSGFIWFDNKIKEYPDHSLTKNFGEFVKHRLYYQIKPLLYRFKVHEVHFEFLHHQRNKVIQTLPEKNGYDNYFSVINLNNVLDEFFGFEIDKQSDDEIINKILEQFSPAHLHFEVNITIVIEFKEKIFYVKDFFYFRIEGNNSSPVQGSKALFIISKVHKQLSIAPDFLRFNFENPEL